MPVREIREWLNFVAEWGILIILIIEYQYDRAWNEHVKHMKRRTKKHLEFERLTTGEMK